MLIPEHLLSFRPKEREALVSGRLCENFRVPLSVVLLQPSESSKTRSLASRHPALLDQHDHTTNVVVGQMNK